MYLTRRAALIGGLSTMVLAGSPAHAASGTRRLELLRGDERIGEKRISVRRTGVQVDVETTIDIDVRLVGLPVYRYQLTSRESWSNGALASLTAQTNDNGARHFVNASGANGRVQVEGSEFTGTVDGNPATTSYWSPAFLERPVWISTQDGRPLNVTARRMGEVAFPTASGSMIPATRWRIRGGIEGLDLFYDRNGEWVGSEFDARGETARFVTASRGAALTPLWVNA